MAKEDSLHFAAGTLATVIMTGFVIYLIAAECQRVSHLKEKQAGVQVQQAAMKQELQTVQQGDILVFARGHSVVVWEVSSRGERLEIRYTDNFGRPNQVEPWKVQRIIRKGSPEYPAALERFVMVNFTRRGAEDAP